MTVTWLTGDALAAVRSLPDASVDLVATSPPFLALRDYNGLDGQWGSEPSPAEFLDRLLGLVAELRRVLAPHGSIAVELGDTFAGSGGGGGDYSDGGMRAGQRGFTGSARRDREVQPRQWSGGTGWPLPKSLCGVPTLFAWSLAYGRNLLAPEHAVERWRVRNVIVWARPNPAVGALGDKYRPATSYITVATPSARRWFDLDAVRTEPRPHTLRYPRDAEHYSNNGYAPGSRGDGGRIGSNGGNPAGAPPLDYWADDPSGDMAWLLSTKGSSLAHYAMWPPKLAERLVLSMCPPQVCRECGEPRRRIINITRPNAPDDSQRLKHANGQRPHPGRQDRPPEIGWETKHTTLGWTDCGHDAWRPGHVLDPFCGTGTTLAAADVHDRDATGIDLDPANEGLYPQRRDEVRRALLGVRPEIGGQLDLLAPTTESETP